MNFEQARKNMVDCQLLTNGIHDARIKDVFLSVPREVYLPQDKRSLAYIDEDLKLDREGAFMLEPMIHALMVQAAELEDNDVVLNIGDYTGYNSAILSSLVSTVITIEPQAAILDRARAIWTDHNHCNIAMVKGDSAHGAPEHAPYSAIIIHGAAYHIPEILLAQLQTDGRLLYIQQSSEDMAGELIVIQKTGDNQYSRRSVLNASVPFIPGLEPKPQFVF